MTAPLNANLHYESRFTIRGGDDHDSWQTIVRMIRSWVGRRVPDSSGIGGRWFYTGGHWSRNRVRVETDRFPPAQGDEVPSLWALRFEHPCRDSEFRRWAMDIGLAVNPDGGIEVGVTLRHWLLPTFIGAEPESPLPSAPSLIGKLLELPRHTSVDASWPVRSKPTPLNPGGVNDFKQWLESPHRRLPVIYLALAYPEGNPKLDPNRLARLVVGAAHVVVSAHTDVDKEVEWLFPRNYRTWNGMVRVYLPGVRFASENDFKRHRFFSRRYIDEIGVSETERQLVRGVVRRGRSVFRSSDRITIEAIALHASRARLQKLKEDGLAEGHEELWSEIGDLETRIEEEKRLNLELLAENERLESEAQAENDRANAQVWHWKDRAESAEVERDLAISRVRGLEGLDTLPSTVPEVLEVLEKLHGDRLVFTPRAFKSASESTLGDPGIAWNAIWNMATVLHPLLLVDGLSTEAARTQFKVKSSGIDVAFTETKLTKGNKQIMRSRIEEWNGREFDITPHVKIGSAPPGLLRVHFAVDRESGKLVIGHCGEHLTTSGSRRRS